MPVWPRPGARLMVADVIGVLAVEIEASPEELGTAGQAGAGEHNIRQEDAGAKLPVGNELLPRNRRRFLGVDLLGRRRYTCTLRKQSGH